MLLANSVRWLPKNWL